MHRLEAALERRVLLDVLAVLVERGRADRAQLAAREHRLEQVGGVDRALGGAGADDRVQLVDEEDDLCPRASAISLSTAFRRSSNSPRYFAPAISAPMSSAMTRRSRSDSGTSPDDDPLREPLDDRGLADARLADQHRVVLRAAREDLDHAADLVVAADDRVELALLARASVRSRPYFSSAWNLSSGFWSVTRCGPRTSAIACEQRPASRPRRAAARRPCELWPASASSRCSVETYSSPSSRVSRLGRAQHLDAARSSAGGARRRSPVTSAARRARRSASARTPLGSAPQPCCSTGDDDAVVLLEQHGEQVLGRRPAGCGGPRPARRRPGSPPGT